MIKHTRRTRRYSLDATEAFLIQFWILGACMQYPCMHGAWTDVNIFHPIPSMEQLVNIEGFLKEQARDKFMTWTRLPVYKPLVPMWVIEQHKVP